MSCSTSILEQVYFGGSNFSYNDDDSGRLTMADKSLESVVAPFILRNINLATEVIQRNARMLPFGDG